MGGVGAGGWPEFESELGGEWVELEAELGGRPELASELGRGAGWERLLGLVFSLDGFFDALPGVFGSLGCGSGYSLGFL